MVSKKRAPLFLSGLSMLIFSMTMTLPAQNSDLDATAPILINQVSRGPIIGLTPSQIRHQYGFDQIGNQGAGQTIAIVDAYEDQFIEQDLATFDQAFGLPSCTTSNSCFRKIYASTHPGVKQIWSQEISLDVEWAHAIAPEAKIILVEAKTDRLSDLFVAVDVAVQTGASVISMSWGIPEFLGETAFDTHFVAPNVTFVAASGDFGNPGFYPAASPYVTGVGGTTLESTTADYAGEVAWSGSGGGQSPYEVEPLYQALFNIPNNPSGRRGLPDVAYDADPNTGIAVYSSMPYFGAKGWFQIGGTSAGTPQWSGLFTIVNSLRAAAGESLLGGVNPSLYQAASSVPAYAANYHDVVSGTNGTCGVICTAAPGYDYVTGIGSPQANNLINALVRDH